MAKEHLSIQHHRPTCLNGQHGRLDGAHDLNGSRPDSRQIKSEVLLRLTPLHDDHSILGECASTLDRLIGSFNRLNCYNCTILDDHALTDIETSCLSGNLPAISDIAPFLFCGLARSQRAFRDQNTVKAECRLTNRDAILFEFCRQCTENIIILPEDQFRGQGQHAKIGTGVAVDVGLLNASQHHDMAYPVGLEGINQFVQLADLDPMNPVDMLLELRFCFTFMSHSNDLKTHLASVIGEDDRKSPIPGDHPDSTVHYRHGQTHRARCHTG